MSVGDQWILNEFALSDIGELTECANTPRDSWPIQPDILSKVK